LRDIKAALPLALLVEALPADWLARLRALHCVALDAHHKALTADIVAQAHRHGFRVACWTPNDPARVAELLAFGTDTVITDAVDRIAPDSVAVV
jgi:glycerophosphoryl diester phosphodiesterase